jgi:3-hydroxyisobutyrate dehydrogenase-like beta-hydroxyacid dehydrogenase
MTRIGFVGLGAMGSRIAGRLLQDHQVYGTNRSAARRDIAALFQTLAGHPAGRAG